MNTDVILAAIKEEAELRRKMTDNDRSLREVTITVKIDTRAGTVARAVEWQPKYHRDR